MSLRGAWLLRLVICGALMGCGNAPVVPRQESMADSEPATAGGTPVAADPHERAKVHTDLGMAYLSVGRFDVALTEASIAIDAWDDYAPAHNLKGLVHMALRQNREAESAFRRALSLEPGNPEINNNYGWFLCQTGKIKESYAHFDKALGNPLYKTPATAMLNKGICALMDKDDATAESYLFRALKLDPNALRAYYLLADIDYRHGRFEEAREWLRKLHEKIEPTAETVWLALRIDRKLGDRRSEAANMGLLRGKFRDSPEYQLLMRGAFD
ncbi:MAG: type IV pilus biogenesis/stability protein PilW [Rhodocyclaceae bacterium]